MFYADKNKFIQIVSNLINNATHYTEEGGLITIAAKREKDSILFSVSDTGAGIPKESFSKIFQRFYQVDSPLTRKIGGTGLGLSLCKGFVEAMGGKIWFESEVGKGTTFFFMLPIERTSTQNVVHLFNNPSQAPSPSGSAVTIQSGQSLPSSQPAQPTPLSQPSLAPSVQPVPITTNNNANVGQKNPSQISNTSPKTAEESIFRKKAIQIVVAKLQATLGLQANRIVGAIPGIQFLPNSTLNISGDEQKILRTLLGLSEEFLGKKMTDIFFWEIEEAEKLRN